MLKRRGLALIASSLALALGAAWIARGWVQARLNADRDHTSMQVVMAAMEIPFGSRVESRQLKVIALPHGTQIGDHFDKPEEVVGRVAVQRILAGELLLQAQFADHPVGSTLAALLKPQLRAITVRVDDVVGVAGFLLPGNHVDVVAVRMLSQQAVTSTVLRDLNVLAVDQTASQDKDGPVVVRAVTLEVTPQQAEVLVKAREEGTIQLTLRSPLATDDAPHPAPSMPLAASQPPPAPSPPPRSATRKSVRSAAPPAAGAGEGITIIRGTNIERSPPSR